jgi:myo-inositol-1(or 4)-monophosphatase
MNAPPLPTPSDDTALLADAARQAGAMALGYFRRDPQVWTKPGNSPVTEADLAVDAFLERTLRAARPGYGWLSEEIADTQDRLTRHRLFVVDPIDGTRGFIRGHDDWTVSLAVVEAGRPVAAALFRPVTGDLYAATAGAGATLNGAPIRVAAPTRPTGLRLAGPRRLISDQQVQDHALDWHPAIASLALRLGLVAEGRLDGALARENAHDWDLAAADLLVHEAGGVLTTIRGDRLVYNRPEPRHVALVAGPGALHAALLDMVRETEARDRAAALPRGSVP